MTTDPPDCPRHEVPRLGYLAKQLDAERRLRRGEKQRLCPACARWVWNAHFHPKARA